MNETTSIHGQPTAFIFMGVSGCGKSTAASDFLAALTSPSLPDAPYATFLEADDFHSPENKSKMASGIPLTDQDRWPWLTALGTAIAQALTTCPCVVATCSALKQSYRQVLAAAIATKRVPLVDVVFVWLDVPQAALEARLRARQGHYMGICMLASQLSTLEPPTVDALHSPEPCSRYRVVRVDCGSNKEACMPNRAEVLVRVTEALRAACPHHAMIQTATK